MEPTNPHRGHSALDPQSSVPGAEPAPPDSVLTRPASTVPRAATVQEAGVVAAPPPVSIESLVTEDETPVDNMPSEKLRATVEELTVETGSEDTEPQGSRASAAASLSTTHAGLELAHDQGTHEQIETARTVVSRSGA